MNTIRRALIYGIALVTVFGVGYFAYDTINPTQLEILDNVGEINDTNNETQEIPEEESEIIDKTLDTSVDEIEENNPSSNGTVIGTILDDSGKPISEALIQIGELSTITNVNGSYTISVPEGTYYVEASKMDYSQGIISLNISAETTYEVSFTLRVLTSGTGEGKTIRILTHGEQADIENTEESFLNSEHAIEHNIVNIQWILSGPLFWVNAIESWADIDVVWGGEVSLYENMLNAGLIAPLNGDQIVNLLDTIPEQINGTDTMKIFDGDVYWVIVNSEPIALLITSNDPQLAMIFIEWMINLNIDYS